jgi:hypothetical protein
MITHVVLLKFKSELTSADFKSFDVAANGLKAIPGVANLTFGKTFTERGQGFTHLLTMEFASKDALQEYNVHPIHQKFVQEIVLPNIETGGVIAMDTEHQ